MSTCPYRPHYPGETCDCPARLAAVTSHTKTPHESGPPYCAECSQAISEWVTWPCRPTPKPTPPLRTTIRRSLPGFGMFLHIDLEPHEVRKIQGATPGIAALLDDWDANSEDDNYSKGQAATDLRAALADPAAAVARIKAEAWDEAIQAAAWCLDNGEPSSAAALAHTWENNPYRADRIGGAPNA